CPRHARSPAGRDRGPAGARSHTGGCVPAAHWPFARRRRRGALMAMAAAGEMRASLAFVERNVNLVKRYWAWEVVWILYTIANSLAVVLIARSVNAAAGSQAALDDAAVDRLVLFLTIGAVV